VPKARDGKPDLGGVWHPLTSPAEEFRKAFGEEIFAAEQRLSVPGMEITTVSKYGIDVFFDAKPEDVPMRPEAAAIFKRRFDGVESCVAEQCLPAAFPLAVMLSEVHKIVQAPGMTMMLLELDNSYRQIYTDGRRLPKDPQPSWNGYSVGHWEGDVFVVETNGLNDKAWIDASGHPRSEEMRMVERYRRRDFGHMDIEITFTDPKYYTRPFSIKTTHLLEADSDILEYVCIENEKDRVHMGRK
jgi:hypothetical protein